MAPYRYTWRLFFEDGPLLWTWSEPFGEDGFFFAKVIVGFMLLVLALQHWMRSRPPVECRRSLVAWNVFHSALSLFATARLFPELYFAVSEHGVPGSMLPGNFPDLSDLSPDNVCLFYCGIFGWCKFVELGDTLFLVIRKKPVSVLHAFHHVTTLTACWFAHWALELNGLFRWVAIVNFFVHWPMYAYYAYRVSGKRPHPAVPRAITMLQMLQLLFVLYLLAHVHLFVHQRLILSDHPLLLATMPVLVTLNLVLFLNYFHTTYLQPKIKTP